MLAANLNTVIILSDNSDITRQREFLETTNIKKIYILGGTGVIKKEMEDKFH